VRVDVGDTWVRVHRGRFTVLVNLAPEAACLDAPEGAEPVLSWDEPQRSGTAAWTLPPDSVTLLRS
jgi:hypothetical protein